MLPGRRSRMSDERAIGTSTIAILQPAPGHGPIARIFDGFGNDRQSPSRIRVFGRMAKVGDLLTFVQPERRQMADRDGPSTGAVRFYSFGGSVKSLNGRQISRLVCETPVAGSSQIVYGGGLALDWDMPQDMSSYSALSAFHTQLQRLVDSIDQRTREAGLQRTKLRMLLAIWREPSGATIGLLADALDIDRNTVVEIVDHLVRQGFVTRERDPHDRRRFLISLTPTGSEWIGPVVDGELRELAAAGPELVRTLRAVIAHASAHAARPGTETRLDVSDFVWRGTGVAVV